MRNDSSTIKFLCIEMQNPCLCLWIGSAAIHTKVWSWPMYFKVSSIRKAATLLRQYSCLGLNLWTHFHTAIRLLHPSFPNSWIAIDVFQKLRPRIYKRTQQRTTMKFCSNNNYLDIGRNKMDLFARPNCREFATIVVPILVYHPLYYTHPANL